MCTYRKMRSSREKRRSGTLSFFLILSALTIITTLVESKKVEQEQRRIRDLRGIKNVRIVRQTEADASNETVIVPNNDTNETNGTKREDRKRRPSRTIKYLPFALPKGYDKVQIPRLGLGIAMAEGEPFTSEEVEMFESLGHFIRVTLRIKNIDDMDENEEEISFLADLILTWTDHVIERDAQNRFNVDSEEFTEKESEEFFRTLDLDFLNKIWKPDVYIDDLVKVKHPELVSQPITLRVNEATGQVEYIATLRIHMKCEMDFHFYPADTQTCEVVLRSSSYVAQELELHWSSETFGVTLDDCSGSNFDFQVKDPKRDVMREDYVSDVRKFSVLRFDILGRRKLSYHLVQTYIPSAFFIVITWLCFLVPSAMIEARIGISMTTLLTLTAMFASVRESSPIVSYVRYIDYWMTACIVFVFLVLLEFSVLYCLRYMNEKEAKPDESENEGNQGKTLKITGDNEDVEVIEIKRIVNRKATTDAVHIIAEFVDKHAFLIFSSVFVFFAIIYWVILLVHSNYFEWEVDMDINCGNQDCKFESSLAEDCDE